VIFVVRQSQDILIFDMELMHIMGNKESPDKKS